MDCGCCSSQFEFAAGDRIMLLHAALITCNRSIQLSYHTQCIDLPRASFQALYSFHSSNFDPFEDSIGFSLAQSTYPMVNCSYAQYFSERKKQFGGKHYWGKLIEEKKIAVTASINFYICGKSLHKISSWFLWRLSF